MVSKTRPAEWVTASVQTYESLVDETTWHQVAGLIAANSRTNAITPAKHRTRSGVRRAEPSRYPLAGLVVCDCCGKKLQGNLARGHAFYRCKVSSDYPVAVNDHPRSLAVRDDRSVRHVVATVNGRQKTICTIGGLGRTGVAVKANGCGGSAQIVRL